MITFCGSTWNAEATARESALSARFSLQRNVSMPPRFAVAGVVADNFSTDRTVSELEGAYQYVISAKCSLGAGRNIAIEAASPGWVVVGDLDNRYDLSRVNFPLVPEGQIHVFIDRRYRSVWIAVGRREDFLAHPFIDGGGKGGGVDDVKFWAQPHVDVFTVENLGVDLKWKKEYIFALRHSWRRMGLSRSEICRVIVKLISQPSGLRYSREWIQRLAADVITFGATEL